MTPPPATRTTLDLALRASRGDPVALDDLLSAQLPALRAYVRLRFGPALAARESASDVVQSVCRELVQGAAPHDFANDAAFRGWLFTAAARKIADRAEYWAAARRDAAREAPLPAANDDGAAAVEPGADAALFAAFHDMATPSQVVMGKEAVERIQQAFEELAPDYREAVLLSRLVGLPRPEVAALMGRTEDSVRHLLFRGLAVLSRKLAAPGN